MSYLDSVYLWLGRAAPSDSTSKSIKELLLKQGSMTVVCVTDKELQSTKTGLKKSETVRRKFDTFEEGTFGMFVTKGVGIKPSDIKKATKEHKQLSGTALESHTRAHKKLLELKEKAKKNAETARQKKQEEMKQKDIQSFVDDSRLKLEEELRLKDIELEKQKERELMEDFEEIMEDEEEVDPMEVSKGIEEDEIKEELVTQAGVESNEEN